MAEVTVTCVLSDHVTGIYIYIAATELGMKWCYYCLPYLFDSILPPINFRIANTVTSPSNRTRVEVTRIIFEPETCHAHTFNG